MCKILQTLKSCFDCTDLCRTVRSALFWVHRAGQHTGKLWNASCISSWLAEAARGKSRAQPCTQTWAPCPVSVGTPKDSGWWPVPIAAAARDTELAAPSAAYSEEWTCCGITSHHLGGRFEIHHCNRRYLWVQKDLNVPTLVLHSDTSLPLFLVMKGRKKKEEKTFSITWLTRFARMKKKMTILQAALYLFLRPTSISCPAAAASNFSRIQ